MINVIRIGDKVSWRGDYGKAPVEEATVELITLTEGPYSTDGNEVYSVKLETLKGGAVLFDFDNGHWAYGNQVAPLGSDPDEWHNV